MEKRYNFEKQEKQLQDFWEQEQIYRFDPNRPGKLYSIDTPPPTVSGSLHIGHLFSYAQAEMIARFHRMQGENVYYPFGFDDNGLPTERLVERNESIRARDVPRREFGKKCRETSARYEEQFQKMFRSMGFSVDWSLQYETASEEAQRLSQKLFLDLARSGKAFCKEAPVLWCKSCRTSIAQAELETKETESVFYTIPFQCGGTALPVATTRPELLFGCVCLFLHPENRKFHHFIGKTTQVPLYGFEIPILADEEADPEKGTGVVMCATFGDSTDARWVEKHHLPVKKLLQPDGTFAPGIPDLAGLSVEQGRAEIVRLLREKGLLLNREPVTHTVAVHERCGTPVEILSSRQWYIDVLSQKEPLLQAAEEIRWHPAQMKERYIAWVKNLKWDWCVSRQRYYGVPIPVWYCKNCGKPVFPAEGSLPVNPTETPYPGVCSCGCGEFLPETAVLDTWATSSVTPLLHKARGLREYPMSMRTHAHEIIRTWTFYSIARSLYHTGRLPWKDLMISGFVLAKKGEKISKSKGNGTDPAALIREHSADALRLWAANARLGTDTFFSPADLQPEKRLLTKLWNAARFAAPLLEDFCETPRPALRSIDRWLLARKDETVLSAAAWLDRYEAGQARHEIDRFFWNDLCDAYIELSKERLYSEKDARKGAQYALYHGLLTVLQLYAPFAPHITEAIYQELFREKEGKISLHLTCWPKPEVPSQLLLRFGQSLKENLSAMRKKKTEQGLSLRTEIDCFPILADRELFPLFLESREDLLACARAKQLVLTEKGQDGAASPEV